MFAGYAGVVGITPVREDAGGWKEICAVLALVLKQSINLRGTELMMNAVKIDLHEKLFDLLDENSIMGICKSQDLEEEKIEKKIWLYDYGKTPSFYMKKHKSIIIIGCAVEKGEDVYKRSIAGGDFPAYKKSDNLAREIKKILIANGLEAKVTDGISFKKAAVLAGIGVYGKNSLIINPQFGTRLRFSAVVTNWISDVYDKPIEMDLCKTCDDCINVCKHGCIIPYKVNPGKCFCKYIHRTKLNSKIPICYACQEVCKYNKK